MMVGQEGVGVDEAVAAGDGGDDAAGNGVVQEGPRGGANFGARDRFIYENGADFFLNFRNG